MARMKTVESDDSIEDFIAAIADETKRDDCRALTKLFATATRTQPKMWGSAIIGCGKRHYTYTNGKPGEICKVGFSPRASSFSFYLPKYPEHAELITQLGKHKYSGGCLHVKKLADVDAKVLAMMVTKAFKAEDADAC